MGVAALLVAALALRSVGALLRDPGRAPSAALGWLFSGGATWLVAAAAGAWIPVWLVLPFAALGFLAESWIDAPAGAAAADLLMVVAAAALSIPPLGWGTALLVGAVAASAWAWLDGRVGRAAGGGRVVIAAASLAVLAVGGYRLLSVYGDPLRRLHTYLPHAGITPACGGEAVDLATGARAWFAPARDARAAAVLLHGADPAGGRQPAACALRRSLRAAGVSVLALDHPGYGLSPSPPADAPVEAWDPLPSELAALRWVRERTGLDTALAVGHSMGGAEALRLARAASVPLTLLFGVSYQDTAGRGERYLYESFHADRRMRERIGWRKWREIDRRFGIRPQIAGLAEDRTLIVYALSEFEWKDLRAGRDSLFADLPSPKVRWPIPGASHYLTSHQAMELLVGDTRVARRLARGFRHWLGERHDRAGSRRSTGAG